MIEQLNFKLWTLMTQDVKSSSTHTKFVNKKLPFFLSIKYFNVDRKFYNKNEERFHLFSRVH